MNQRRNTTVIVAVVLMCLMLIPVVAQTSNTNTATATVFSDDVDNYMDVTDWITVDFEKAFLFGTLHTSYLDLGGAKKFGSLYLGGYFSGDLLSLTNNNDVSVTTTTADAADYDVSWEKNTGTTLNNDLSNSYNNGSVLFGFGKIGVQLGIAEFGSTKTGKLSDTSGTAAIDDVTTSSDGEGAFTNTVYDENGYDNSISYIPRLSAGMNLSLNKLTIKPYAGIKVPFELKESYYKKTETTITESTTTQVKETAGYKSIFSSGIPEDSYIGINPWLGADFVFKGDAERTIGIAYAPKFYLYNASYVDAEGNEVTGFSHVGTSSQEFQAIKKISYGDAKTTTTYTTKGDTTSTDKTSHTIAVNYKTTRNFGDRLKAGCNFTASTTIIPSKVVTSSVDTTKTYTTSNSTTNDASYPLTEVDETVTPDKTVDTLYIYAQPTLSFGASYAMVPNKLTFNAGMRFSTRYDYTKEVTTYNGVRTSITTTTTQNGVTTTSTTYSGLSQAESSDITQTLSNVTGVYKAGVTFNATDNAAVDVILGAWNTNGFNFDDILTNLTIQCTLKF